MAQGTKRDLLQVAGCLVRTSGDRVLLGEALAAAGLTATPDGTDALRVEAGIEQVGTIAFTAGLPVTELRAADGAGLEEMFLELTSETQRDPRHDQMDDDNEGAAA